MEILYYYLFFFFCRRLILQWDLKSMKLTPEKRQTEREKFNKSALDLYKKRRLGLNLESALRSLDILKSVSLMNMWVENLRSAPYSAPITPVWFSAPKKIQSYRKTAWNNKLQCVVESLANSFHCDTGLLDSTFSQMINSFNSTSWTDNKPIRLWNPSPLSQQRVALISDDWWLSEEITWRKSNVIKPGHSIDLGNDPLYSSQPYTSRKMWLLQKIRNGSWET